MPRLVCLQKPVQALTALLIGLSMGACSMDDVEFNGGLFKAVGLGQKAKASEPTMAARPGLVLPPNLERLPAPGAQPGSEAGDVAALADPDKLEQVSQAELERQQAEYCKKHYEQAMAHGDTTSATLAEGPLGRCQGSMLNIMNVKTGTE